MKNILLIGIGGTGSKAVDIFNQKLEELGNPTGNHVTALVFDTDSGDLKKIKYAKTIAMADSASVGTICDRLGKEHLREWFPCDEKAIRAQEMVRGASQWRKKSYLAFLNLMNKPQSRSTFISALEEMTIDPQASCEVYVVASVAGGTGSGSFIPIALYAKRYLRKTLGKDPIVNAMIVLPDVYAGAQTAENRVKVYANAYAILRELNAINLVSRNYNAGLAEHKKAPIRFKIGNENEPNVGLLFDSMDKQFWTPEAAPFSQIFLLDHIPGLNSVTAHNIVLANSLYTMLCTDIGASFDSEFSNHELLRSQSNGSNAIYAGVSTAQITFPKDAVLDYLAHRKTLDACTSELLVLHNAVEAAIKENERQAKSCGRNYDMKNYEYAKIVVEKVLDLEANGNEILLAIKERCIDVYDADGHLQEPGSAVSFCDTLDEFICNKIKSKDDVIEEMKAAVAPLIKGKKDPNTALIQKIARDMKEKIFTYYLDCVDAIKRLSVSTADAILSLDGKKKAYVDKDHSVVEKLLKKNGKFIHPVAALIQLCLLRTAIEERHQIEGCKDRFWEELKSRTISDLPEQFYELKNTKEAAHGKQEQSVLSRGRSIYKEYNVATRFKNLISSDNSSDYLKQKRTNTKADAVYVLDDAKIILDTVFSEAQEQMTLKIYDLVAYCLDLLISKYRSFFKRFDKEKEGLTEDVKSALRKESGVIDSVINVYSSPENKEAIYKIVTDTPSTTDAVVAADDVVGHGVFAAVENLASAEYARNNSCNERDSGAYRTLFGSMVNAYRESMLKSEEYVRIGSYNVIEAIVEENGGRFKSKQVTDALAAAFAKAQEIATPPIRLSPNAEGADLVNPSTITVFMMSTETARYLKRHADDFGLQYPVGQASEADAIHACAEEFVHTYSGQSGARVAIVDTMPDQILYCTGEIMDISPLYIAKFNELGEDNVYFRYYQEALDNWKKYGTDMWNPHLGNDLHKRGYLPYMNEAKEKDCDVMVVKALLYGFQHKRLTYELVLGESRYYFCCGGKKIKGGIDARNAAQLLCWLRNQDELVAAWSKAFDEDLRAQMLRLPSLASDNTTEVSRLEGELTRSAFMNLLNGKLYVKKSKSKSEEKDEQDGPSAIEFAYMVKTSEELDRDCDDAERILQVLYSIFVDFCEYRTNSKEYPERFIKVYGQQLGNFYEAIAGLKIVQTASERKTIFNQFVDWFNANGVFNAVSEVSPVDENGNIRRDAAFDCEKAGDNEVKSILEKK